VFGNFVITLIWAAVRFVDIGRIVDRHRRSSV